MRPRLPLAVALAALFVVVAPATAIARPQSTLGVDVEWIQQSAGMNFTGQAAIGLSESGDVMVAVQASGFRAVTCADGTTGLLTETWFGNDAGAQVDGSFGKRLSSSDLQAVATISVVATSSCDGSVTAVDRTISLTVEATSSTRIERTRDPVAGIRLLERKADTAVVAVDGMSVQASATIFESIAKGNVSGHHS